LHTFSNVILKKSDPLQDLITHFLKWICFRQSMLFTVQMSYSPSKQIRHQDTYFSIPATSTTLLQLGFVFFFQLHCQNLVFVFQVTETIPNWAVYATAFHKWLSFYYYSHCNEVFLGISIWNQFPYWRLSLKWKLITFWHRWLHCVLLLLWKLEVLQLILLHSHVQSLVLQWNHQPENLLIGFHTYIYTCSLHKPYKTNA